MYVHISDSHLKVIDLVQIEHVILIDYMCHLPTNVKYFIMSFNILHD